MRRAVPVFVRLAENLTRMMLPEVALDAGGKRRVRACGRREKPGQVASVGMPQSSKICVRTLSMGMRIVS